MRAESNGDSATEAVYFSSLKKPRTSLHNTDTGGRRNPSSGAWPPADFLCPVVITNRDHIKPQAPMLPSTPTTLQGRLPLPPRCDVQTVYFPQNVKATRRPRECRLEASSSLPIQLWQRVVRHFSQIHLSPTSSLYPGQYLRPGSSENSRKTRSLWCAPIVISGR